MTEYQTPRVTQPEPTLELMPGKYRVSDLLQVLESLHGNHATDVRVVFAAPALLQATLRSGEMVISTDRLDAGLFARANQESLPLPGESPAADDVVGQRAWLDGLPKGTLIRDNTTQRQLRKEGLGQWATAGGFYRSGAQLVALHHTFTLIRMGDK